MEEFVWMVGINVFRVDTSLSLYLAKPLHGPEIEGGKDLGWRNASVRTRAGWNIALPL